MIVPQITAIVNQLVAAPIFAYGSLNEIEVQTDDIDFKRGLKPVVILFPLKPTTPGTTLMQAVNTGYALYMQFLYQTEFDQNTAQNEAVVLKANNLMEEFLVKIQYYRESQYANRFFKIHSNEKYRSVPVYNKFSVNASGVDLTINVGTMLNTGYDPSTRPVGYIGV